MTLSNLKAGEKGIIENIEGKGAFRRRLLDMGLTPNTEIKVEKVAPLGDPILLKIRGYSLSIRKDEANKISLKYKEKNKG